MAPMRLETRGLSIIVPTYREAANLEPLCDRVFLATRSAGIEAEMIIVDDDSRDGSAEVVGTLAERHAVRIVVRRGERGLSSAVVRGFAEAFEMSGPGLDVIEHIGADKL